jgi:hypothetical protein
MTPFDLVKSINQHRYQEDISAYKPIVINKAYSFSENTLILANAMNIRYHLDTRMQYDFLFYSIRPKTYQGKWIKSKKDKDHNLEIVQEFYKLNTQKARQVLSILTDEQIEKIKESLVKGG